MRIRSSDLIFRRKRIQRALKVKFLGVFFTHKMAGCCLRRHQPLDRATTPTGHVHPHKPLDRIIPDRSACDPSKSVLPLTYTWILIASWSQPTVSGISRCCWARCLGISSSAAATGTWVFVAFGANAVLTSRTSEPVDGPPSSHCPSGKRAGSSRFGIPQLGVLSLSFPSLDTVRTLT